MQKLVFVDSDGTLKDNKGNISDKTKIVLKKLNEKGVEVIITTGRPRYHALRVKNASNASRYVISSNGAEVYDDETKNIIYAQYIDIEDILKIYDIANKYESRFIMTVENKEVVTDCVRNENQILLNQDIAEFLNNNKVKQIFIRSESRENIKKTYDEINKIENVKIVNESSFFTDGIVEEKGIWFSVGHKLSNKGIAIKSLCNHLNVSLENTYGFGNDYNDIKMFETVNHSIVMNNANDDLKNRAKIIAKSNDEDGVASFLEELFL